MSPNPGAALHQPRIYVLAIIVSVGFLLLGILFIAHVDAIGKEEIVKQIRTATAQTRFAFDEFVREEFETLSVASVFVGQAMLPMDEKAFVSLMKALDMGEIYTDVGVLDSDGRGIRAGSDDVPHECDLSEEPFVQQALAGQMVMTEKRRSLSNEGDVFFLALPILDGGVLFASIPEQRLYTVLEHSRHAGEGIVQIIKKNGDYILRSDHPQSLGKGDNVFDIDNPLSPEKKQQMLATMAAGKSGYFEWQRFSLRYRVAAYEPLSVDGWYVFYVVPMQAVYAGPELIRNGATAVIAVAVAIFVLLILMIRQVNNKGRKELERLAFEDPVTGQYNYRKFLIDAEALLKANGRKGYSIWYSDIVGFKYINDLFGRDMGDQLLRYWAECLMLVAQRDEAVARVNADIFVTLRRLESYEEIVERSEYSARTIAAFPALADQGYRIQQHYGIYILNERDGELSIDDMIYRANVAEKSVKGFNVNFAIYSDSMRAKMLEEKEMERQMKKGLRNGEFVPYFQPQIDIRDGDRVMGMEVLVRWISKEKGMIPPSLFVPLFEKNGFIVDMDRWLFAAACDVYRQNFMEIEPPLILSVNVSRLGLLQSDFVRFYTEVKNRHGIPDGCLELEFTESLVFENDVLFQSLVADLQHNGFLCSLDDFGAGYSSLNILQSLRVDVLKLDGAFFRYDREADRGAELVKNIISMAKALGMKTVAEGVELEFQVEQLRAMGCNVVQGYCFAQPMPLDEFVAFLKKQDK